MGIGEAIFGSITLSVLIVCATIIIIFMIRQ